MSVRAALLSIAIVATALGAGCSDDGDDPSGEEILERSVQKMSETTVVYEVRVVPRQGQPNAVEVFEYTGDTTQRLWPGIPAFAPCTPRPYDPAADRSDGGKDNGFGGGTAPEEIEVLGELTYDGSDAWQIRYAYNAPSVEGPYPVEVTEWIAKDDYRVLRVEREVYDPFGLAGQLVLVARSFDEDTDCPSQPELDPATLIPLTTPRLEAPGRTR